MNDTRKKRPNSSLRNRTVSSEIIQKQTQFKGKMNNSPKNTLQRHGSVDSVRKKVEEEGRTARNLVTWNVPLEDGGAKTSKSPVSTPKKTQRARSSSSSSQKPRDRTMSPAVKKLPGELTPPAQRAAKNSKKEIRNRYWAFLFDNLKRAVDEIYLTCESDESVLECKEAIMMLEQSTTDFTSLIKRLKLLRAYENAEESQRPTSLAWEVRKTSPGKSLSQSQGNKEPFIPSPTVSRTLNFNPENLLLQPKSVQPPPAGNSWADRVKNSPPVTNGISAGVPPLQPDNTAHENTANEDPLDDDGTISDVSAGFEEDQDGWATVQKDRYGKIRRTRSGNIPTCKNDLKSPPADSSAKSPVTRRLSAPVNKTLASNSNLQKHGTATNSNNRSQPLAGRKTPLKPSTPVKDSKSTTLKASRTPVKDSGLPLKESRSPIKDSRTPLKDSRMPLKDNRAISLKDNKSNPLKDNKTSPLKDHNKLVASRGNVNSPRNVNGNSPRTVTTKSGINSSANKTGIVTPRGKSATSYAKAHLSNTSTSSVGKSPTKKSISNSSINKSIKLSDSITSELTSSSRLVRSESVPNTNICDQVNEDVDINRSSSNLSDTSLAIVNQKVNGNINLLQKCGSEGSVIPKSVLLKKQNGVKASDEFRNSDPGELKCDSEEVSDDGDTDHSLVEQLENALQSALNEEESLDIQLEKENEEALQQASVEELNYLQEIAREQSMDIEVETEPETEVESDCPSLANTGGSIVSQDSDKKEPMDWDSLMKQFEGGSAAKQSWGDIAEEEEVASRTPGRSVYMHEKLSSPSRKRSPKESRRRYEEKQKKAQELRGKLMQDRTERIRMLTSKVEEVRHYKDELWQQRRELTQRKLEQAEEKRQIMLQSKVRKAHEEETKANEIAFINTLEAQNKLHDILVKHQESEARIQDIQEERQRKLEEDAAKKLAVEERRKALEVDRLLKLQEMHERRAEREKVAEQRQLEKEKDRQEAKRIKEREREERMTLLNVQHQQHIENLQKKIKQKQTDTEERHKEKLEKIRGKAFEMSILRHSSEDHNEAPQSVPYEKKKFCIVCNVMISSEVYLLSHLRGKKHQQAITESNSGNELSKIDIESFNLKHILDAPPDKPDPQTSLDKERQKSLKKRCKKIRQRMAQRGAEYETALSSKQTTLESEHRAKLQKVVKDINKYLSTQDKGPWPQSKVSALDRALGEISRRLEKKVTADQTALRQCGGLTILNRILLVITDNKTETGPVIPVKSLVLTCNVFQLACKGCYDNCHYMLFSNKLGSLIDLLIHQLSILVPDNFCSVIYNSKLTSSSGGMTALTLPSDPLASALLQLIATVSTSLSNTAPVSAVTTGVSNNNSTSEAFISRANDIVSYIISVGVVDKLSIYLNNVRGPLSNDAQAADFVQHGLGLLIGLSKLLSNRSESLFEKKKCEDPTHLISTFEVTELCGIVSLMYGVLLHSDAPSRGDNTQPPDLPTSTTLILTTGFKLLNHLATLDLQLLQSNRARRIQSKNEQKAQEKKGTLGSEGVSLELRHIASYLIWSCNNGKNEELLHEVILCVGYFTILSQDNQNVIQSGQPPTVLQQLCQLPFQYFSDPRLTTVLFPSLIACCYNCDSNKAILQQELSCDLLANFIEEKCLESIQPKSHTTSTSKTKESPADPRMTFSMRIPQDESQSVQAYFTSP